MLQSSLSSPQCSPSRFLPSPSTSRSRPARLRWLSAGLLVAGLWFAAASMLQQVLVMGVMSQDLEPQEMRARLNEAVNLFPIGRRVRRMRERIFLQLDQPLRR